jgi:hypothetical protein
MSFNKSFASGPVSSNRNYPASFVEASMARTFYPKYVSYSGDGTGRDAYIIMNNGGLTS